MSEFQRSNPEAKAYQEAWDSHETAERIMEQTSLPFSEAMDLAISSREALSLHTKNGSLINIKPLSGLADLEESRQNPALGQIINAAKEPNTKIEFFNKSYNMASRTDFDKLEGQITDWINSNPQKLQTLGIKDWTDLSPLQAIELAALLINDHMTYEYESAAGSSLRNPGYRELMQLGVDQLFERKGGVCLQMADAEVIVLQTIKGMQKGNKLAGTEVASWTSDQSELDVYGGHQYDIVFVGRPDGETDVIALDITGGWFYKDKIPTWKQTIDQFYDRVGTIGRQLHNLGVIDRDDASNQTAISEWASDRDAHAKLNSLVLIGGMVPGSGPESYDSEQQLRNLDATIKFVEDQKNQSDPNTRLVMALMEATVFQHYDERLGPELGSERKLARERVWQELNDSLKKGNLDGAELEHLAGVNGFLRKTMDYLNQRTDVEFEYEIQNGLDFSYYEAIVRTVA